MEKDQNKTIFEDIIKMMKNLPIDKSVISNMLSKYTNLKTVLKALLNELCYKIEELQLDKDHMENSLKKL